jgi:hypothetical protein
MLEVEMKNIFLYFFIIIMIFWWLMFGRVRAWGFFEEVK